MRQKDNERGEIHHKSRQIIKNITIIVRQKDKIQKSFVSFFVAYG
jgi:hypothetical protein